MAKKSENEPLAESQRLQAEAVAAQEEADKQQPTPTQEEADKAKLGLLNEFAPSGEPEAKSDKAEEADKPSATYKTRSANAG